MQQLLCEPEDRLGSEASSSVLRPDSLVVQARRSGFIAPDMLSGRSADGAELIKVCQVNLPKSYVSLTRPGAPLVPRHRLGKYSQISCSFQARVEEP